MGISKRHLWMGAFGLLGLAACQAVPLPPGPPEPRRTAVVRGEWPQAGRWQIQAISLAPVALVQAEVGGPGLEAPLVASAAVGSDRRFAVPFAAVPLGANRPVRVVGFAANGRSVPGVVLQGWLTVTEDGQEGVTNAAATPVGATYRHLWNQAAADPMVALIAGQLSPEALQAHITQMVSAYGLDYSLVNGTAVAAAVLKANRARTAFDLATDGVRLPAPGGDQLFHPATVRGTVWGLTTGETLTSMAIDDPLSPLVAPLPTVPGTPFRLFPVVPGLRQLTLEYAPEPGAPQRDRFSRSFVAAEDVDTVIDVAVPHLRPRQVPPGGTLRLTGAFLGTTKGTARIRHGGSQVPLTVQTWQDGEITLTVPTPLSAGSAALEVNGTDWGLEVPSMEILAGVPRIESATVLTTGPTRQLEVAGTGFSAFAADHRLTLTDGTNVVTVLSPSLTNGKLVAVLPAGFSGAYSVTLSIGGVASPTAPTITL